MDGFNPKIIAFLCNWCSYEAADAAGRARMPLPTAVRIIRVPCSGRVDPQTVMDAFRAGADGVIVIGCRPGECHYKEGNTQALRKYVFLKKMLIQLGVEGKRLQADWISASEQERLALCLSDMVVDIRRLGPLTLAPVRRMHLDAASGKGMVANAGTDKDAASADYRRPVKWQPEGKAEGAENG
jgi:F420-non-reducing hydrogenase iron-sulfur subunit